MYNFTLYSFKIKNHQVELVLPEVRHAEGAFEQLRKNHNQLSKYLKWVNSIDSVEKEQQSIKMFQQKMIEGTAFNLIILVDDQVAGMIDLHELNQTSGEVGYWLASEFQHLGIMTKCVEFLVNYSLKQLKLSYLLLRTAQDNIASQHVAKRAGFQYVNDDEDGMKVFKMEKKQ
ncbi:GNAT family N-acetyltransferase [uncultured Lactobacillus sp.]|uniref:GNAT family N-acetyltransferase n=1 Tax=uncultured Lactobacillus sp. TaxID=153152 RepID=UPI00260DBD87|nr:GNAT family N-acetyltransferase [uncultured Lactobacillus sp.]